MHEDVVHLHEDKDHVQDGIDGLKDIPEPIERCRKDDEVYLRTIYERTIFFSGNKTTVPNT